MSCEIAVFHLIRKGNTAKQFIRFLDSYRMFKAGVNHQFVLIFKGFEGSADTIEYTAQLKGIEHELMYVSDDGFDITAYEKAAKQYQNKYKFCCFLNSHAEILCDDWLKKLQFNLCQEDVGLVGATGSLQSHRGSNAFIKTIATCVAFCGSILIKKMTIKHKAYRLLDAFHHLRFLSRFPRFPNPHIRTNAFLIKTDLLLRSFSFPIATKNDAYEYESGHKGLTKFVETQGLKTLIVGKDGRGFDWKSWDASDIYMQGSQNNLLVADNMTRKYEQRQGTAKSRLIDLAWTPQQLFVETGNWFKLTSRRGHSEKVARQQKTLVDVSDSSPKILIYGAGELGIFYLDWLEANAKKVSVAGFVDSFSKGKVGELNIYPPEKISTLQWDYVLVSSNESYHEIVASLRKLGVKSSSII